MTESSLLSPRSLRQAEPRAALVDFFYHWFSELEAQGEETTFRLGNVRGSAPPSWVELPHHSFDGLGGLAHVLAERRGTQLSLPTLPGPYPGLPARWLAALRLLFRRPPRLLPWRSERAELRAREPSAQAWQLLSADLTDELRQRARAAGISLNALLLHALTSALEPLLETGPGSIEWVVPVNMRGVEAALRSTDNQAVTLDIHFPMNASAQLVDAKLRAELHQKAHFGAWQLLRCLGHAGPKLVRALARRELELRKHGSFSNLGNLRSQRTPVEPEWWLAFNPVQRTRPIGAACLTFHGRLSLTLNIHAVLGLERTQAQGIVNEWLELSLAEH